VIDFETYHEVRRLSRELNLTPSQIAAETGLNIKTIRKWLDKARYEPRSKATRSTSKLDPYKDLIVSWLESRQPEYRVILSSHGTSPIILAPARATRPMTPIDLELTEPQQPQLVKLTLEVEPVWRVGVTSPSSISG
jgi:hypothetical protein